MSRVLSRTTSWAYLLSTIFIVTTLTTFKQLVTAVVYYVVKGVFNYFTTLYYRCWCQPFYLQKTFAGRSGLAVTCLTAVWEDQGSNPTVGSCTFIVNITTICSLGHGLRTLTAVPRSTQPSTLCGTVKWVSAFGLSNNNKWRWWVWLLAAYRRTHSPGRLAWSEGRRPLGAVPYSSHEPGELSQWLCTTMTAP